MPHRVCLSPGCPNFATPKGKGHCIEHSRQRERSINRLGSKIYATKRWKLLRRRKITLNPICERCGNDLSTDVHHKHGVEADPWSLDGLEALCHSCHSKETRGNQLRAA